MTADSRFAGLYTSQFVPATSGIYRVLVAADMFLRRQRRSRESDS